MQVREGDSAILTCRAGSGSPTPDVQVGHDDGIDLQHHHHHHHHPHDVVDDDDDNHHMVSILAISDIIICTFLEYA